MNSKILNSFAKINKYFLTLIFLLLFGFFLDLIYTYITPNKLFIKNIKLDTVKSKQDYELLKKKFPKVDQIENKNYYHINFLRNLQHQTTHRLIFSKYDIVFKDYINLIEWKPQIHFISDFSVRNINPLISRDDNDYNYQIVYRSYKKIPDELLVKFIKDIDDYTKKKLLFFEAYSNTSSYNIYKIANSKYENKIKFLKYHINLAKKLKIKKSKSPVNNDEYWSTESDEYFLKGYEKLQIEHDYLKDNFLNIVNIFTPYSDKYYSESEYRNAIDEFTNFVDKTFIVKKIDANYTSIKPSNKNFTFLFFITGIVFCIFLRILKEKKTHK